MAGRHVVVIGAGIGGLSAAIDLCSRGLQVTLLEQHAQVGGKMHQSTIGGLCIDSGPTVFTMRHVFDQLLARAQMHLEDIVDLVPTDLLARHFWKDGSRLDLYTDIEKTVAEISALCGESEARSYRRFAVKSAGVYQALDHSFMQAQRPGPLQMARRAGGKSLLTIVRSPPFLSLWRSLGFMFSDPRLRQLFARYSTYCGSSPFMAPATLMLIAHAERAGVWMLRGGMQSLAEALSGVALRHGCDVRLRSRVDELLCNSGAVTGVRLADGQQINADAVIFNGDPAALAQGAFGPQVSGAVKVRAAQSLSAVTLATVAGVNSGIDLAYHNVFFGDNYRDEFDAIFKRGEVCNAPTIYVCAQDRLAVAPRKQARRDERLFCLMNAPAGYMSQSLVDQYAQRIVTTLNNHGLHWQGSSHSVIESPNTFEALCPRSGGALYGQPTHGWSGSFKRSGSATTIRNLYLAGGGVHPGAGVPMVSLSGQLAAEQLCNDLH